MSNLLNLVGRILISLVFFGGAIQKVGDPGPVTEMITGIGLPDWLIWPVAAFNLIAAVALITGPGIRIWALLLAAYCIFTSYFHWELRADPWQVTIVVKNWAIAGGLMILASQETVVAGNGRRRAAKTGFQPDQK
ncbi:MAG: DoxX family protein [Pseudomonadota bacterium]|nr:DoxX family protein [Pseudomonadota bacterium]